LIDKLGELTDVALALFDAYAPTMPLRNETGCRSTRNPLEVVAGL